MAIASIKPKIIGLVLHGDRIQFFLQGTYSAVMGDGQDGCQPILAQLEPILLGCFFAIKDRPLDAPHLYNRTKATWAKDNALRVPIKSHCKPWHRRSGDQATLVTLHSRLPSHSRMILKLV